MEVRRKEEQVWENWVLGREATRRGLEMEGLRWPGRGKKQGEEGRSRVR